jgi:hypothetical protein
MKILSAEHKQKISVALKGCKFSEPHLAKLRADAERRKGISPSEETRRKQSDAAKRRIRSTETYEKIAAKNRGRKKVFKDPELRIQRLRESSRAPDVRELRRDRALRQWRERDGNERERIARSISDKLTGRKPNANQLDGLRQGWGLMAGDRHWNWKGGAGRSYPTEFRHMRPLVFERDGHACVKCSLELKLVVHHIDAIKSHNCWLNLVTLCRSCNHRAEAKANKAPWSIELRLYTESVMTEKRDCAHCRMVSAAA